MVAPIIAAIIVAAISAATTATTTAINAAPTKGDRYRKARIKQLERLAEEGFTPAQEEELRSIGLGAAATAAREARSRRADALASLAGGATAQDIMAQTAREQEIDMAQRRAVENEVRKADIQERNNRRQELNALIQQQEASGRSKRAAVTSGIESLGSTAANLIGAGAVSNMEEGADTVRGAAERTYGQPETGGRTYAPASVTSPSRVGANGMRSSVMVPQASADISKMLDELTPEQRRELQIMLGEGAYNG